MRSTQKRQETVTFPSHAHLKPHVPRFTEIIYRFKVIREKATNKIEPAAIHRMKEKFTTLAAAQRRKNPGPVDSSLKRECSLITGAKTSLILPTKKNTDEREARDVPDVLAVASRNVTEEVRWTSFKAVNES